MVYLCTVYLWDGNTSLQLVSLINTYLKVVGILSKFKAHNQDEIHVKIWVNKLNLGLSFCLKDSMRSRPE